MFFTEGFYGHDDAIYAALRLLRILGDAGKGVDELLSDVPRFHSTPELRVDCPESIKFEVVARAVSHFSKTHQVIDVDGVRVLYGDGWGLIRASNTQPVLVLRFEALTRQRMNEIRNEMESWLSAQGVGV
jgi:phosphomannomutase/phosphoglucomutase